jgi:hypothetical protein
VCEVGNNCKTSQEPLFITAHCPLSLSVLLNLHFIHSVSTTLDDVEQEHLTNVNCNVLLHVNSKHRTYDMSCIIYGYPESREHQNHWPLILFPIRSGHFLIVITTAEQCQKCNRKIIMLFLLYYIYYIRNVLTKQPNA